MWLEQTAWAWMPLVAGLGAWIAWCTVRLAAQVRELQRRLDTIDAERERKDRRLRRVA
ncbi:MAG TPA: hypothetical protein VNU00_03350 [Candidatus Binataceae bacterium]|nr:hypothetical protein [Candidatus Binataceae bacterium]